MPVGLVKKQRAGKLDIIYKHCYALGSGLLEPKESTCPPKVDHPFHEMPQVCKDRVCANVLMLASSHNMLPFFIPGLRSDASLTVSEILLQLEEIRKSLDNLPICNPVKATMALIKEQHKAFELEDIGQYEKHLHIQAVKSGLRIND